MKNWRDVPKPPHIEALETDPRGYPIFYTVQPPEGAPLNFRAINPMHIVKAARYRLCGLCGTALPYWIWFTGGEESIEHREFGEPAMHLECLEYALLVCPFLAGRHEPKHAAPDPDHFVKYEHIEAQRPTRVALYRTRDYRFRSPHTPQMAFVFKAAPALEIQWRTPVALEAETPA